MEYKLKDGLKKVLAEINLAGNKARIKYKDQLILATKTPAGSNYRTVKGDILFSVRHHADDLKIYDSKNKFLWKVKRYQDKLKISNNLQNLNAWQIKFKDKNKASIYSPDATKVYFIRTDGNKMKLKNSQGKALFELNSKILRPAFAAIIIAEMDQLIRLIIIAELL